MPCALTYELTVEDHRPLKTRFSHLCQSLLYVVKTEVELLLVSVANGVEANPIKPNNNFYSGVIKWKHFPRYWPFVQGIRRSLVNSPHKGQWHGTLMFSFICTRKNAWVNKCEAGDLRRHHAHCDVIVMKMKFTMLCDGLQNHRYFVSVSVC